MAQKTLMVWAWQDDRLLKEMAKPFLKAIAAAGSRPSQFVPGVKSMAESGYDVDTGVWIGLFAPAATPKSVIARLNAEIVRAVQDADTRKRFLDLATDPVTSTPEELAAHIRREVERLGGIVRALNLSAD